MSRKRSRIVPVVVGAVGAYLIFVITAVALYEPTEPTPNDMDWDEREQFNLQQIATLKPGLTVEQVLQQIGSPSFNEAFTDAKGELIQVMRYRTHRTHGDGMTTHDETTPLIFRDGTLSSWGDAALNQLQQLPKVPPQPVTYTGS